MKIQEFLVSASKTHEYGRGLEPLGKKKLRSNIFFNYYSEEKVRIPGLKSEFGEKSQNSEKKVRIPGLKSEFGEKKSEF